MLGNLEVRLAGESLALPRSKKTRALLAYLAATGCRQTRAALCDLLWESTDDPRGALRWSLSKLRAVVNTDRDRLLADREAAWFDGDSLQVDLQILETIASDAIVDASNDELERAAGLTRGEFLEGLDLPDLFEYQAWCIAVREWSRELRCRVLAELVRRLRDEPEGALPFARALVQVDQFSVEARLDLLKLLWQAGKRLEAREQYDLGDRLYRELSTPGATELLDGWRALSSGNSEALARTEAQMPIRGAEASEESASRGSRCQDPTSIPIVGRLQELATVRERLSTARTERRRAIVAITGEPGIGKSRLASQLLEEASRAGVEVMSGRAYEAESARPLGPWADALGTEIAGLLPEADQRGDAATREGLFATISALLSRRADAQGALLVLDDVQWLDQDSAELLHYVARVSEDLPLTILLLARSGELEDNEPVLLALHSLKRDGHLESLELQPLSRDEVGELVSAIVDDDSTGIYQASRGNPLYALELARTAEREEGEAPASIIELVRGRVSRLPGSAVDVLRWCAILGHAFEISRLEELSSLGAEDLVEAIERLEQHALVAADNRSRGRRYSFVHDLVRQAIYSDLSGPRRQLMHRRVAELFAADRTDSTRAKEIAHHAGLAGDAALAVGACVEAGLEALRVFANADAEVLARRGLELVGDLEESERIAATLELLHVRYSARTPDRESAAARLLELAERALDLGLTRQARLGFQMLSFLRWESSSMGDAHENILQAERVSRTADPTERSSALAHAARCLVLLERNMGQAEAFLTEARLLAGRESGESPAVRFAAAMLHEYRGEHEAAEKAFRDARWDARQAGDRLAEFRAIQHWTMLEIDRERLDEARRLAIELESLGSRLRQGAEGPTGRALLALVRRLLGEDDASTDLEGSIEELRRSDARYELAFVLTRLALGEVATQRWAAARRLAEDGLESAIAIGRASDTALSHALIARTALETDDRDGAEKHRRALEALREGELATGIRSRIDAMSAD